MLKKITLIFIKILPSILALNFLIQISLLYIPVDFKWLEVVDIICNMLFCIIFTVMSFTFKFCKYHRLLLYVVFIGLILYLISLFIPFNLDLFVYFIFGFTVFLLLIFLIIFIYLKYGRVKTNSERK
jgi:hypothetical protein